MEIRNGQIGDLEAIKKISSVSLITILPMKYFEKYLDHTMVAVEKNKIIGYLIFKKDYIMSLAVHPDFRKKGIGKKLIEEFMKKSKTIRLRTRENNKNAINFFNKLGFKQKRKIEQYYRNEDNAIEMELIK